MKTEKVGSGGSIYNYYYSLSSPSEALNVTLRAPDGDDKEYVAEGVILMFFPVNFDSLSTPQFGRILKGHNPLCFNF